MIGDPYAMPDDYRIESLIGRSGCLSPMPMGSGAEIAVRRKNWFADLAAILRQRLEHLLGGSGLTMTDARTRIMSYLGLWFCLECKMYAHQLALRGDGRNVCPTCKSEAVETWEWLQETRAYEHNGKYRR